MIDHNLLINHMPDIKHMAEYVSRCSYGAIDPQDAAQDIIERLIRSKVEINIENARRRILSEGLYLIRKNAKRNRIAKISPMQDKMGVSIMDDTRPIVAEYIKGIKPIAQIALVHAMRGDTTKARRIYGDKGRIDRLRPYLTAQAMQYGL